MTTGAIFTDTSYYQAAVDDTYPHRWLSFRACDGTFHDPKFDQNYAWAEKACQNGKLAGYTIYAVYRPGVDIVSVVQSMVGTPSKHVTVMVDVESWNGEIGGNHSTEITRLIKRFAKWLGSRDRVIAYGNVYDLGNIYPHRPSWLNIAVASYGTVQPTVQNMVIWQYYGGADTPTPAGLPRSSAPFGVCDHNIAPGLTATDLANTLGVGPSQEEHVSVLAAARSFRAFALGGKYATRSLMKKYPRLVRKTGVIERLDHLEAEVKTLLAQHKVDHGSQS